MRLREHLVSISFWVAGDIQEGGLGGAMNGKGAKIFFTSLNKVSTWGRSSPVGGLSGNVLRLLV